MTQAPAELHHGSHNHLLTELAPKPAGLAMDAVIVPTFRGVDLLRDSIAVGRDAGCPVIALCSGEADAEQSVELGRMLDGEVHAVDLRHTRPVMPRFRTDDVLGRTGFRSTSDLSLKRNVGLLVGRIAGWRRVLFLDDDIWGVDGKDLARAAAHLDDGYRAVGLKNRGFPDNSVICHAYREVGAPQDSFIGGGAMLIDPMATRSFFPNIYNEDWFFLMGDGVPFRGGVSGSMVQRSFDPFANPQRAAVEELGDTLAEGLFWLLDYGRGLDFDGTFWGEFLHRRRELFDFVVAELERQEHPRTEEISASVKTARGRSAFIQPWLCHAFVSAWQHDLEQWGKFIDRLSPAGDFEKALTELGIAHLGH